MARPMLRTAYVAAEQTTDYAHQAYTILKFGFTVLPVIAGIAVAVKPKLGALVVTAWLWGIIINLLLVPGYFDVALRDLGLSIGALALARLAEREE